MEILMLWTFKCPKKSCSDSEETWRVSKGLWETSKARLVQCVAAMAERSTVTTFHAWRRLTLCLGTLGEGIQKASMTT